MFELDVGFNAFRYYFLAERRRDADQVLHENACLVRAFQLGDE